MKYYSLFIILICISLCHYGCKSHNNKVKSQIKEVPKNSFNFDNSKSFYTQLVGTIGDLPITMEFNYNHKNKSYTIYYQYNDLKEPLKLSGKIINNRLVLERHTNFSDHFTEQFYGCFTNDKNYFGQWYNADSTKQLEFKLTLTNKATYIPFDIATYDTTLYCNDLNNQTYSAIYHFSYLNTQEKYIQEIINNKTTEGYANRIDNTLALEKKFASIAINSFQNYKKNIEELDESSEPIVNSTELDMDAEVIKNDLEYLILNLYEYSYNGDAHGYDSYSLVCIDKQKKRALTIEDLTKVYDSYLLLQTLNNQISKDNGLSNGQDFTELEDGLFVIDKVEELPKNFYITKNAIVFLFNAYELKSYAAGEQYVRILKNEIK